MEDYDLNLWGRTTVGQAMYMDGVIQSVANRIASEFQAEMNG